MYKVIVFLVAFIFAGLCLAEPSVHDIYQAAEAGNFARADAMMGEVLNAHPDSAKAHFVHAELLVKEGKLGLAQGEFGKAKALDPTLKFASPAAIEELSSKFNSSSKFANSMPTPSSGNSNLMLFIVIICVAGVALFFILRRRNTSAVNPVQNMPMGGNGFGNSNTPMNSAGGVNPAASGGSGLMGSLATGAALGAGMIAGEVLAHKLFDSSGREIQPGSGGHQANSGEGNYDMGGQDFGVSGNDWGDSGGDSSGGDW